MQPVQVVTGCFSPDNELEVDGVKRPVQSFSEMEGFLLQLVQDMQVDKCMQMEDFISPHAVEQGDWNTLKIPERDGIMVNISEMYVLLVHTNSDTV